MQMTEGPNVGDLYPSSSSDTFISYGMPSALNFRGLVGVRNKKKTEFVYGNGTDMCRFNPLNDMPGFKGKGYCGNIWEKYSYLGEDSVIFRIVFFAD